MSQTNILTNASLLATAICFWSYSIDYFIFKLGLKTITLYDLATLFGLKPYGEEIDPAFTIDTISFNYVIIKSIDYNPFIKSYYHKKDEVIQVEHVAFLRTWISKFIYCNRSKKVSKAYLGKAVALAIGMEVALGPFVLNHIMKSMNDLKSIDNGKLNGTVRGPIWMV